ncbi:MAG: hypothetical protein H0W85_04500 [Methylotenera sp.]|nr:hypothetical protein [Methylotenera sp.]
MFKKSLFITLLFVNFLSYANAAGTEKNDDKKSEKNSADKNYSGMYACKGNNNKVGDYTFTVTLKLNRRVSHDDIYVYDVMGETENATSYFGSALAIENKMALNLKVSDNKESISGAGLATFKQIPDKGWMFSTKYYEPDKNGGVSGGDECTWQSPTTAKKAPDEPAQPAPKEVSSK